MESDVTDSGESRASSDSDVIIMPKPSQLPVEVWGLGLCTAEKYDQNIMLLTSTEKNSPSLFLSISIPN